MGKKSPRRGSLAFWHRARAKRLVPRMRAYKSSGRGLAEFAGYKAGMTRIVLVDDKEGPTKGQEKAEAVTVIEAPPLFVFGARAYAETTNGLKTIGEIVSKNSPKQLKRFLTYSKKEAVSEKLDAWRNEASECRLLACTMPWNSGFGKKTPEVLEIALAGSLSEKIDFAKSIFGKEVKASDVFSEGEFVDVTAVTKGKGWQGVVKRFGVALNPRKATKARRHGGAIGGERQAKVMYTIPRAGQTGFHRRTDKNKRIVRVSGEKIFSKPFPHYGIVENEFLLLEGSVPGPRKRVVRLRKSLEKNSVKKPSVLTIMQP